MDDCESLSVPMRRLTYPELCAANALRRAGRVQDPEPILRGYAGVALSGLLQPCEVDTVAA